MYFVINLCRARYSPSSLKKRHPKRPRSISTRLLVWVSISSWSTRCGSPGDRASLKYPSSLHSSLTTDTGKILILLCVFSNAMQYHVIVTTKVYVRNWGPFPHSRLAACVLNQWPFISHLSKHLSDLKENGTQKSHQFLTQFFNTLPHGVVCFITSGSSKNHLLTGWDFLTPNQKLLFNGFWCYHSQQNETHHA